MSSPAPSHGRSRIDSHPSPSAHPKDRSHSRSVHRRSISPRSGSPASKRSSRSRSVRSDDDGDRRNGLAGGRSRSRSRGRSLTRSRSRGRDVGRGSGGGYRHRSDSRSPSRSPQRSSKIVVEKLTKNVNENHLREIFGTYGEIESIDLPMNRQFMTNRGTAYILYYDRIHAEAAISHMHEAQLDGAVLNVSIVIPRRTFSRSPPPITRPGRGDFGRQDPRGGGYSRGGPPTDGGRHPPPGRFRSPPPPPARRFGGRGSERHDIYRPGGSPSRSRSPRGRSRSYSSRSRSPPPRRRGAPARRPSPPRRRRRSPSYSSYSSYSDRSRSRTRSRSRSRGRYGGRRR